MRRLGRAHSVSSAAGARATQSRKSMLSFEFTRRMSSTRLSVGDGDRRRRSSQSRRARKRAAARIGSAAASSRIDRGDGAHAAARSASGAGSGGGAAADGRAMADGAGGRAAGRGRTAGRSDLKLGCPASCDSCERTVGDLRNGLWSLRKTGTGRDAFRCCTALCIARAQVHTRQQTAGSADFRRASILECQQDELRSEFSLVDFYRTISELNITRLGWGSFLRVRR